ncbi:WhiB family transcriptional regulator [Streptomyces sp. NPDC086783]|uniref:WhiB family transcriptional regulator n=1 Tax=Streptomyces sp. NPDC086783 TaxID=3365758 RepID=UPI00382F2F29
MNVRPCGPTDTEAGSTAETDADASAAEAGATARTGEGSRAWESSASCRHQDADLFFSRATKRVAMAICAACPVLKACRDAVLRREKGLPRCRRSGVVAGLTGPQRYALEDRPGLQDRSDRPDRSGGTDRSTRSEGPDRPDRPDRPQTRRPKPSTPVSADLSAARDQVRPTARRPLPCGTRAAYQRHLRRREPVDDACRAANARSAGQYRRTGSTTAPNPDETPPRDHGGAGPRGADVIEPSPAHPHRSN